MSSLKFAVVGVVKHGDEVLIGKKSDYKPNKTLKHKWHVPGGKVEEGEDLEDALVREIKEESGLNIEVGDVIDVKLVKKTRDMKFIIVIWYECTAESGDAMATEELSEVKWVPKRRVMEEVDAEAVEMFPPLVKRYFQK